MVPVVVEEEIEDEAVDQPLIVVEQPHTVSQLLSNLLYMSLVADNHGQSPKNLFKVLMNFLLSVEGSCRNRIFSFCSCKGTK